MATKISFFLGYQGLAVPVTGVFARLTELNLKRVWFHGPGQLGDAVSSPRCPCLQRLTVDNARGLRDLAIHSESMLSMELRGDHAGELRNLAIHSESMLSMELSGLRALSQLTVVAPALKALTVASCFVESPPIANISASLLSKFYWDDEYDPSSIHLGKMAHLQYLRVLGYLVYGPINGFILNGSCLSLLQCFKGIKDLFLPLVYPLDIENCDYMMEHMAELPDTTFLCLVVIANGHAFGASAFHVLRLCSGIRRLMLELANTVSEAQVVCSSDCICVQLVEWETEEFLLNHLEEVEIGGLRGTEHEVAFVKRLFDWGTELKEMTVNFHRSISKVKAKELYQTFPLHVNTLVLSSFFTW